MKHTTLLVLLVAASALASGARAQEICTQGFKACTDRCSATQNAELMDQMRRMPPPTPGVYGMQQSIAWQAQNNAVGVRANACIDKCSAQMDKCSDALSNTPDTPRK